MVYHHGEVKYLNGNRYVGELEDGKRNGIGTYYCANGDEFTGTWKDGKRVNGSEIFQGGDHYVGDYENDLFHGNGSFYIVSRSHQEYWKEGHPESLSRGLPPITPPMHPSEKLMPYITHYYDGGWANGKPHGKGIFYWGYGDEERFNGHWEGKWDDGVLLGIEGNYAGEFRDKFADYEVPMNPEYIRLMNSMLKVKTLLMRGNLSDE